MNKFGYFAACIMIIAYIYLLIDSNETDKKSIKKMERILDMQTVQPNIEILSPNEVLEIVVSDQQLKDLKESQVQKMLTSSKESALSGAMFGLLLGGPVGMITKSLAWGCIGGIRAGVASKRKWNADFAAAKKMLL